MEYSLYFTYFVYSEFFAITVDPLLQGPSHKRPYNPHSPSIIPDFKYTDIVKYY